MITILAFVGAFSFMSLLAYKRASLPVWLVATVAGLFWMSLVLSTFWLIVLAILILTPLIVCQLYPLRRLLITRTVFAIFTRLMPPISATEREALEAGTVSWEGELFFGEPTWQKLLTQPAYQLTAEEQEFLDGPVNELCRMIDDWEVTHVLTDLPKQAWQYIKENKFFGMIIPKQYGGLEFSASAQAAILAKLYSKSVSLGATVSVPNSLGPAELLLKYGTQQQQTYYLPRLASGEEIPCFALTGPTAGSDASSMPDSGVVCRGQIDGNEVVGIRLNWDKRYITLAPAATVLGLAFKLFDPDGLLGATEDIGITCALIPVNTPGVVIGRRHFPLNMAFLNGPTQGKDVFIPFDWVIGGVEMVGQGWHMLMECLSAGRAISLPAGALGGGKAATLATSAYARIRRQFNLPVGYFEGLEAPLARIAGYTYIIDAAVKMTAVAIDQGAEPPIASAIVKYHTTELGRKISIDAMDIHGGKGICLGPRNYLARGYQSAPIGITVEGANILTRNMIIFGQGLLRCHPYLFAMFQASVQKDLVKFDHALFGYLGHIITNKVRAFVLAVTHGRLTTVPASPLKRYFQLVTRYSAALAFAADFCLLAVKGNLKRRERLSARLGDILSRLYLVSAVLKQFTDNGELAEDMPLVEWACQYLFYEIEYSMERIISNMSPRWLAWCLQIIILPIGRRSKLPDDALDHQVARLLLDSSATRSRLTGGTYTEAVANHPIGLMEAELPGIIAGEDYLKKVTSALRDGTISGNTRIEQIDAAEQADVITARQAEQLRQAETARRMIVAVDDFAWDELAR